MQMRALARLTVPAATVLLASGGFLLALLPPHRPGPTTVEAQARLSEAYRLAALWDGSHQQGAPGSLLAPAGMELAGDALYVVDHGNHRIQRFDAQLVFQAAWGQLGSGPADLTQPRDVAVDGDRVYVSDRGNGRIGVFGPAGQPVAVWTVPGLRTPWGLAARGGVVYVSQPETGEVFVLREGATVARWTGLSRPRGMAVGPDGRVLVADEGASAVRTFNPDGTTAADLPISPGLAPLDVAADEYGDLYVASAGAILWFPAGAQTSKLAMYYTGLQGVAVSSRHGVLATVTNDARLFHGVVSYAWRPRSGVPAREWLLLDYPLGRLNGPHAIHAGRDGRIWILDDWPRIQAFGRDGKPALQVSKPIRPVDVAVAANGDLFAGEARRLFRLRPPYAGISNTVRLAEGTTDFWLTGLSVRADGARLQLLDSALARVREYGVTQTVQPVGSWPLGGDGGWQLYWDIAVPEPNPRRRVYAVNRGAAAIEVYESGAPVARWAVDGISSRAEVGPDGALFVLTVDGRIWKLAPDGTLKAGWDAAAFSAGASTVADLAVDAAGQVYTVDRAAHTVRVWAPDPAATPEPVRSGGTGCRLRGDKRAAPASLRLGGTVRVELELGGECPHTAPQADILLVIDKSFSMNASNKITDTRQAALAFIDSLDLSRDQIGVVAFDNSARLIQPLTTDRAAARAAVQGLTPLGGTDIAAAIRTAGEELAGPRHRAGAQPVLILLTDGRDDEPDDVLAAAAAARSNGTRIFTIGFGDVDPMVMVLAASTPEDHYYAPDTSRLAAIYAEIARRISASVLAQSVTVVDRLPADMSYRPGSAQPAATWEPTGRTLTWQLAAVPFDGATLRYDVQPQQLGRRPTNLEAVADYVDGLGQAGRLRFPVPEVEVVREAPTPTPTFTPFPTPTPRPTATPIPLPLYLPIALLQICQDRTVYADVVLVIDTSSSMNQATAEGGPTRLQAATAAASQFVDRLVPAAGGSGNRVAVVSFNSTAALVQGLSGDHAALTAALGRLQTATGTYIDTGLTMAYQELTGPAAEPANNRVIVLLTDGDHQGDDEPVLEIARQARAAGILIYAIGFGADTDIDFTLLRAIAGAGSTFIAPGPAELERIFADIAYTIQCVNRTWP